ncbi:MAG: hypothetical protein ACRDGV_03245 [Candidatus Limnocylindria bacterium]
MAAARGRLPRRVEPWDVLLLGVATHKLSRLVTKGFVAATFSVVALSDFLHLAYEQAKRTSGQAR